MIAIEHVRLVHARNTGSVVDLSDLHFGAGRRLEQRCVELVRRLLDASVDHVVVTGDITERGELSELERFVAVFEPLASTRRLTVVPGNHDRLGDDVAELVMGGRRIAVERKPGLHLVLVDSTRPNPGWAFVAHGELDLDDLEAIDRAVADAEPDALVVVLLHHHPLPRPHESTLEALGSALGLPYGEPLAAGRELLARLHGHADLVLHGHRHRPYSQAIAGPRPLHVYNAGCSPALGRARLFVHRGGRLLDAPRWIGEPARDDIFERHPAYPVRALQRA